MFFFSPPNFLYKEPLVGAVCSAGFQTILEEAIWLLETENTKIQYSQICSGATGTLRRISLNMPFRCLEYVTRIYEGIVPIKKRYAEKVYKIPNPDFYVVYVGKKKQPLEQELRLSDAFYTKDSSKLELVVKVKNCTDPNLLPITGNCGILKEYCRFIEIVEKTYNKHFAKRSFKKAIELAMSEGILTDYLDRKSREVINMLCAKYDYKMDIAVKKEEAFADGQEAKAEEAAIAFLIEGDTPEKISRCLRMPLEKVLKLKESLPVKVE